MCQNWKHVVLSLQEVSVNENKNITFFELEVFLELSIRRSQRGVSRSLGLTPSHVSKILNRLESKLEKELFKSSQSGIILTRNGLTFVDYAKKMITTMAEFQNKQNHLGEVVHEKPVVTIATASFLSRYIVAPQMLLIQKLLKDYRIRLVEMSPDVLVESALKGAFDIALNVGKLEWTKSWSSKKIGNLSWGLYAGSKHPLAIADNTHLGAEEIRHQPFIVPTYWNLNEYAIGNDLYPISWQKRVKGHEASTAETAIHLVANSDHLGFVPRVVASSLLEEGRVSELQIAETKEVQRPIYLNVNIDNIKGPFRDSLAQILAKKLI